MAVRFGLNQAAYIETAVVTAFPLTCVCWFRVRTITLNHPLMWVGDKDVADYSVNMQARGGAILDPFRVRMEPGGGVGRSVTRGPYSANTWHHGGGVLSSTSSRFAYLDGVAGVEGTALSAVPSNWDRSALGALLDSTPVYVNWQEIAYAAIWNVAQTPTIMTDLAAGANPLKYPDGLEAFWPLGGEYGENYLDRSGNGHDLTTQGTPTFVDDPPLPPYRCPLGVAKAQVFGW